jgi:nitrous oxide reductase accessory protein NosL
MWRHVVLALALALLLVGCSKREDSSTPKPVSPQVYVDALLTKQIELMPKEKPPASVAAGG